MMSSIRLHMRAGQRQMSYRYEIPIIIVLDFRNMPKTAKSLATLSCNLLDCRRFVVSVFIMVSCFCISNSDPYF